MDNTLVLDACGHVCFFNDTATTEIYTLSLHDALPIFLSQPENMALLTYGSPNGTLLPTTTSLLDSPELVEKKPQLEGFAEAMKCGVSNVQVNEVWPQMEAELNTQLGLAMYGEIEVDEALAAAKAEA